MRKLLFILSPLMLLGCNAPVATTDAESACRSQGYAPGTDAWEYCMEGGGAPIATGPGSPYANRNPMD